MHCNWTNTLQENTLIRVCMGWPKWLSLNCFAAPSNSTKYTTFEKKKKRKNKLSTTHCKLSDCKLRSFFFFFNVFLGNKNRLTFQSCKADLYTGVQLVTSVVRGLEQVSQVFCNTKQWKGLWCQQFGWQYAAKQGGGGEDLFWCLGFFLKPCYLLVKDRSRESVVLSTHYI